ncbi:MAG: sigma-54-dependent transcriptional regulator [Planctomycetota bacterium]
MSRRVLVVEDDAVARRLLVEVLENAGCEVRAAASAEEALAVEPGAPVVVTDVRLARMSGLALLRELRARDPDVQVIVMTAFGSLQTAVDAIRDGAFDYMSKPFRVEEMANTVGRAFETYEAATAEPDEDDGEDSVIIGRSQAMTGVFKAIARVSPLKTSVLLQGDTGTGKELIARAIHEASRRAAGPYVTVNCASLPEGLLESELFGHTRGAFTGAATDRKGLFAAADGGTILLDEIGDMPLAVQAKLLRVLESGEVRPVGSTSLRTVDVRVVAATHRDLEGAVDEGAFRRDLYYRLNAVTIRVPPLREREGDLPLLAAHFLRRHVLGTGRSVRGLTEAARRVLESYSWPGNVRELSHVLERAVALSRGPTIDAEDLPDHLREASARTAPPGQQTLDEVEKAHILAVVQSVEGNRGRASEILGIDRKTLYRKLLRYGIDSDET